MTYRIIRFYFRQDIPTRVIKQGVTLEEARAHCRDPETRSRTATSEEARAHTDEFGAWFDARESEQEEEEDEDDRGTIHQCLYNACTEALKRGRG